MTLPTNTPRAFNEWMRRFIDDPARFKTEEAEIDEFLSDKLNDREPDYGAVCTVYLQRILDEMDGTISFDITHDDDMQDHEWRDHTHPEDDEVTPHEHSVSNDADVEDASRSPDNAIR